MAPQITVSGATSFQPKVAPTTPAAPRPPTGGGLQFGGPSGLGGGGTAAATVGLPAISGPGPATFGSVTGAGFGQGGSLLGGGGGFSASPRTLNNAEVIALNQQQGTFGTPDQFTNPAFNINQLLGPFGFIADPSTFRPSQIPFIEARLNFENLLMAGVDRESALNLIQQQRDAVGQTEEQQLALATARRRLEQPEPFTPQEVALQTGQIRGRAARGLEGAQRQFQEDFARQGLAGSATSFQQAQLQQAADRQASDELQRFAIQNALQRDVNEASAIDRLQGITGESELRQIALNQALSELLTAQRGQFDLSALAS